MEKPQELHAYAGIAATSILPLQAIAGKVVSSGISENLKLMDL